MGSSTVLPQPGKRNVLISAALPFINNVPHLGNIIGSVLSADAFARYCRGRGVNTLYVGGTDEYGTTTETKALQDKCTPRELCDKYHVIHADIYRWFNISFDIFGRTTTELQTEIAQAMFLKLNENGYLKERSTTQLYCLEHSAFLADRFVEGECASCGYKDARGDQCDLCGRLSDPLELKNPRCKIDGSTPVTRDTAHIFFELDKLQPEIEAFFQESAAKGEWSSNAKEITAAWLKQGLQPRSITRDMKWGTKIPLPGYDDKVIYPWWDACIGYVSITAGYTDQWELWWRDPDNVQLYHFIGKDNTVFHSVIFPGTQIATRDRWTKAHHLSVTDYLTYEGGKFSKSRNIGVFGDSAQKSGVSADIWRYYLLSHRPETGDTDFEWAAFISSNNNELLKNLGNFVSRIVKFAASKHYDGVVPSRADYHDPTFDTWTAEVNKLLERYIRELDAVKLRAGITTVLLISQQGNQFLQSNGLSNKLVESEPSKCAAVVNYALHLVHLLAAVLEPYMPDTAKSMNAQLGAEAMPIPDVWTADSLKAGHKLGKPELLFSRIPPEKEQEWREAFGDDEVKKLKEEEAAKKAARKAAKKSKKPAASK